MAFDPGAISATLAAAVGDDPALIAELRVAFADSAGRAVAAMALADGPAAWCEAAWRLNGLAASFGAVRLMTLAGEALQGGVPDRAMLGRLQRMLTRL